MKVVVFAIPGLVPPDPALPADIKFLPPAALGDIYRAACEKPDAIVLLNGFLETAPAVRHKEILWALSNGIDVYGSAGMGALRAAELAPFGMAGVGRVYESYNQGHTVRDDEVVALYRASPDGHVRVSEPLTNIRRTIGKAVTDGIVSAASGATLESIAANMFFKLRTYRSIVEQGGRAGVARDDIERFREWLALESVDQQREDAGQALATIGNRPAVAHDERRPHFTFERTKSWDELCTSVASGEAKPIWPDTRGAITDNSVMTIA